MGLSRLLALAVGLALSSAAAAAPIRTDAGLLEGVRDGDLLVYKGVPFAAPPTGDLRWRAPQPVKKSTGLRKADAFGPACMQAPGGGLGDARISEDCLYLNVWRPAKASGPLPIMLFVHGGGFTTGAGSIPALWGDNLARKGVIVVTVNYRLGPFGWLALPGLSRESGQGSGDYGLMDVIAALKWVKANARALGGDARRITVFGESSGSEIVSALLVSPEARGLFDRAVGESNGLFAPFYRPQGVAPLKAAEAYGAGWAKPFGADDPVALRKLPAEAILKPPGQWPAVFGGKVLPETPYDAFLAGHQADIPTLVGGNATEGIFFQGPNRPVKAADWDRQLAQIMGDKATEARTVYPSRTDEEAYWAQAHLFTDVAFAWHVWTWARLQSRTGHAPIRMWRLEQPWPAADPEKRRLMGTPHVADLFYVFQHFEPNDSSVAWTEEDRRLGELMASYWTNFAKTGDPNGPGLPEWPAFGEDRQVLLRLKAKPELGAPDQARMQLIDAWMAEAREPGFKPEP